MPTPRDDESRPDYLSRCMEVVMGEEEGVTRYPAYAMCNGLWEQAQKEKREGR